MNNYEKYQEEYVDKIVGFIDSYGRCIVGCQYIDPKSVSNKILSKYKDNDCIANYFIISKKLEEYPKIPTGINVVLGDYKSVKNWTIYPDKRFINMYNNGNTVFIFCDIDIMPAYNIGYLGVFTDYICPDARHAFIGNYKRELEYRMAPINKCKLQIV